MVRAASSRRRVAGGALLGLALACLPARAAGEQAQPRILDRVVAVVEGQALTESALEFEARVFLIERGGSEAASAPLTLPALKSVLDLSIAQRLQTLEADRLQAYPLDEQALLARLQAFEARMGGRAALERFLAAQDADDAALAEVLGRAVRAERILDSKIQLRAQVSEAEVHSEYERHPQLYGASFTAAHNAIRERLTRERYGALAQAELAALRQGANVRLLPPFSDGGGAP